MLDDADVLGRPLDSPQAHQVVGWPAPQPEIDGADDAAERLELKRPLALLKAMALGGLAGWEKMARLDGESSNELLRTLQDWDACLQDTSLAETRRKPSDPLAPALGG